MEEIYDRSQFSYLDKLVGAVAGAVCARLSEIPGMRQKHFALLPAVAYKVKLCLSRAQEERRWTDAHLPQIANDIQTALVPLLRAFELPSDLISTLAPEIERAALNTLMKAA